jgi:hypothetical protein
LRLFFAFARPPMLATESDTLCAVPAWAPGPDTLHALRLSHAVWRFGLSDDLIHWDSWADIDPGSVAPRLGGAQRGEFCARNATVGNGLSSAVFANFRDCYKGYAYASPRTTHVIY